MLDSLENALKEQIRDLYSAENQLVKALPKMAKSASSPSLREALQSHLDETVGHVERLQEIATLLEFKPGGKKCKAMEGLIEEGKEVLEEDGEEPVIDLAIIGAAQRVEHYEIAAYGTARAMAERLGQSKVVELLQETLDEEGAADKKLTDISESEVLEAAASAGETQEEE
jgi:ferritin-like metal-binding protein YciE